MQRVMFILTTLAYGGAEIQVVNLAIQLRKREFEVHVITLMTPKAFLDVLNSNGIKVTALNINNKFPNPIPILKLIFYIRKWKPTIIHSHMVHPNILIRVIRPFLPKTTLICTAHNIDETGGKKLGKLREIIYRVTDPLCDMTTQVSQAGLQIYIKKKIVKKNKIMYIPNGIDTKLYKPDTQIRYMLRSELGLSNKFVWVAIGRMEPQKDYINLINAFSEVVKKYKNSILVIIGDGFMRHIIIDLIDKLGLSDHVMLLGIRKDIPKLLNIADGFVMSSSFEGLPLVLLEAAATQIPMVVTDVGGNKEIVQDSKSGYLVPPKNYIALAKKMLILMMQPKEERIKMGIYARNLIERRYDINIIVSKWINLYQKLINNKCNFK